MSTEDEEPQQSPGSGRDPPSLHRPLLPHPARCCCGLFILSETRASERKKTQVRGPDPGESEKQQRGRRHHGGKWRRRNVEKEKDEREDRREREDRKIEESRHQEATERE